MIGSIKKKIIIVKFCTQMHFSIFLKKKSHFENINIKIKLGKILVFELFICLLYISRKHIKRH